MPSIATANRWAVVTGCQRYSGQSYSEGSVTHWLELHPHREGMAANRGVRQLPVSLMGASPIQCLSQKGTPRWPARIELRTADGDRMWTWTVGICLHQNLRTACGPHAQRGARLSHMQSTPLMGASPMGPFLKVLLVEDSKVLTDRLTEAIDQIADVHLIGTAETEAAAVAVVEREPVDVIILDLHLRQGSGFGVIRALATTQLTPQIIVLTNYDLAEYKKVAFALGATHFLDKARDSSRLAEVLHEVCEAHHSKH